MPSTADLRTRAARRFEPDGAGSVAGYRTRVGDGHAHHVCRACGVIVGVDNVLGSTAGRAPADDVGFELDRTEIVFRGLCPACVAALNDERLTPRATSRPVPPASQEEGST